MKVTATPSPSSEVAAACALAHTMFSRNFSVSWGCRGAVNTSSGSPHGVEVPGRATSLTSGIMAVAINPNFCVGPGWSPEAVASCPSKNLPGPVPARVRGPSGRSVQKANLSSEDSPEGLTVPAGDRSRAEIKMGPGGGAGGRAQGRAGQDAVVCRPETLSPFHVFWLKYQLVSSSFS